MCMYSQPAIDNLLTFKVQVDGNDLYVEASEDEIKQNQTPPCKSRAAKDQSAGVVIVGGGAGGWATAEELCQVGSSSVTL